MELERSDLTLVKKIKSLKLSINSNNNTVSLPDDYVDSLKGVVGADGILHVFGQNKNLNMSRRIQTAADTSVDDSGKYGGLPQRVLLMRRAMMTLLLVASLTFLMLTH